MTNLERAKLLIYGYVKSRLEKTDTHVTFGPDEVYVVWFGYTLGHWKALLSTTLPDGMYYEVTYNSTKCETYIDAYKKFENICIKSEDMKDALDFASFHASDPLAGAQARGEI